MIAFLADVYGSRFMHAPVHPCTHAGEAIPLAHRPGLLPIVCRLLFPKLRRRTGRLAGKVREAAGRGAGGFILRGGWAGSLCGRGAGMSMARGGWRQGEKELSVGQKPSQKRLERAQTLSWCDCSDRFTSPHRHRFWSPAISIICINTSSPPIAPPHHHQTHNPPSITPLHSPCRVRWAQRVLLCSISWQLLSQQSCAH